METLADKIKRDGALNELDAVGWVIRLAKRVEVLHSRGITHGGVTPASVRVDSVSRASHGVLADAQPDAANTAYHSPERVTAGGRSTSDDTWAVAATLYAALTGSEPFGGADEAEIRQKVLIAAVAPLAVYDVGDDDLQRVLDEALARDIQQRTVQISALREALETWHPDPTTRDLPPLQEDEDYDDDEATVMRPAMLPMPVMTASSKRASHPRLDAKGDSAKAVPAAPASSDEATSAPGTHPSGTGPPNAPRPAAGTPAQTPRPASVPRAVPGSGSRAAPGASTARVAAPRLLARKPDETAAAKPAQRSPLQPAALRQPVIREVKEAAVTPAAGVPTTVRSSVVKVHNDDDDDEATVMREGLAPIVDTQREGGPAPAAGQPIAQVADSPPESTAGESRTTQVSPEMPGPAAGGPWIPLAIDRSEATLVLPADGTLGAADTLPAPPGSVASREVARVGEALRASPVAGVPAFAAMGAEGAAGAPSQPFSQPMSAGLVAPMSPGHSAPMSPGVVASPHAYGQPGAAGMGAPPPQAYGTPASPAYGAHPYGQPDPGAYGAPPQSYRQPNPAGFAPPSEPWSAPRQSIPPPSRLLPAILVALVVLIVAAFSAFALLRYRATGRVFGAAPYPSLTVAASFRST